ncbi:MAG: hypothetical protein Q4F66_11685 [Clostridium sp.]|nr:hypothetical protein [Clostridium sp.]
MGFFKKEEVKDIKQEKAVETNEVSIKEKEADNTTKIKAKSLSLFDVDTIKYVIENFPSMSIDIQNGLLNLSDILEKTIDHIEDKSSELVKEERNFELSQAYRDTSIAVYGMAQNIKDYVLWMEEEYEKNEEKNKEDEEKKNDKIDEVQEEEGNKVADTLQELSSSSQEIAIYNDFTGREPEAFILRADIVKVDDWNDLLVKTAEVLNKKYKNNKNSKKVVGSFDIVNAKSSQNEFRDTAIEMLNEYKISLDQFKVIIR